MDLSTLKPAEGSTKTASVLAAVKVQVTVELLLVVTKELVLALVTSVRSVSKVVRCLYNAVFLNSVLETSTALNTKVSTSILFNSLLKNTALPKFLTILS